MVFDVDISMLYLQFTGFKKNNVSLNTGTSQKNGVQWKL